MSSVGARGGAGNALLERRRRGELSRGELAQRGDLGGEGALVGGGVGGCYGSRGKVARGEGREVASWLSAREGGHGDGERQQQDGVGDAHVDLGMRGREVEYGGGERERGRKHR